MLDEFAVLLDHDEWHPAFLQNTADLASYPTEAHQNDVITNIAGRKVAVCPGFAG